MFTDISCIRLGGGKRHSHFVHVIFKRTWSDIHFFAIIEKKNVQCTESLENKLYEKLEFLGRIITIERVIMLILSENSSIFVII